MQYSGKITICHYNIGHLSGPVYRKRKSYPHEITTVTLKEFFPYIAKKMVPKKILDAFEKKADEKSKKKATEVYFPDVKSSKARAEILCEFINSQNFDVVTLNEIDRFWPFDLVDLLVKRTHLTQAEFSSCYRIPLIMNNGNAILSKYPMTEQQEAYLDTKGTFLNNYFNGGRRTLKVKLDMDGEEQNLVCTHLIPITGERKKYQVKKLTEVISSLLEQKKQSNEKESVLLCADLNSTLKFKPKYLWGDNDKYTGHTLRQVENLVNKNCLPQWFLKMFSTDEEFKYGTYPVHVSEKGTERPEFSADRFLDYILPIGKDAPKVTKLNVYSNILISDHYPLIAEVDYRQK